MMTAKGIYLRINACMVKTRSQQQGMTMMPAEVGKSPHQTRLITGIFAHYISLMPHMATIANKWC